MKISKGVLVAVTIGLAVLLISSLAFPASQMKTAFQWIVCAILGSTTTTFLRELDIQISILSKLRNKVIHITVPIEVYDQLLDMVNLPPLENFWELNNEAWTLYQWAQQETIKGYFIASVNQKEDVLQINKAILPGLKKLNINSFDLGQ